MARPSELERLILLALARLADDDAYGIPVRDEIARQTGRDPSLAAVYAALARLEEAGLVASWESDPEPRRGGRARKHFRLSPPGVTVLREARGEIERMWAGVDLSSLTEGTAGGP
jgi:PadR family transcriptional regulator PadR